jgi:hypothetical protein
MPKIAAWEASDGTLHKERSAYQSHEIEILLKETFDRGPSDVTVSAKLELSAAVASEIVTQAKAVVALLTLTETSRPGGRKALKKPATPKPEPANA